MTDLTSRHIAIVGPTAVGKSSLALAFASAFSDVEIVSVDSMQVYRGMNIGTAKPTPEELRSVPHHVIDLVDASEEFTLTQFQTAARAAIADIESRGKRAVLVGGTGLYLQAVIDGYEIPSQFPEVRADIEAQVDTAALHARLAELDPDAAEKMEPTNRRRVVRALEVTLGSGRPFSSFGPGVNHFPDVPFAIVGLWMSRERNAIRIEQRVDAMLADGWLDEVKSLTAIGQLSKTAAQALGYRELIDVLNGALSSDEARQQIIDKTRSFARRQRMWFRRDPRIKWFGTPDGVEPLTAAVLRQCQLDFEVQQHVDATKGGDRS